MGTLRVNKSNMKDCIDHLCLSTNLLWTLDPDLTKTEPIAPLPAEELFLAIGASQQLPSSSGDTCCCLSLPVPRVLCLLYSCRSPDRVGTSPAARSHKLPACPFRTAQTAVLGLGSIILFPRSSLGPDLGCAKGICRLPCQRQSPLPPSFICLWFSDT